MAVSIKFDNTEIRDTTHNPRYVKHESFADRELNTLPLTREDGEVLVSEKFGVKVINLIGYLTGTSQANLESNIDTLKELFSRLEKNLDVDWNGSTLRFVATCRNLTFDRDHYHNLFVPWAAEFVVLSGEGKDTAATTLLNEHAVTTTTPGTDSFTFAGSKPPKPKITIKGNNFPTGVLGVEYKDTDTGEKIVITNSVIGNTDSIIIDCLLKKVTADFSTGTFAEKPFYGVFPNFKIGANGVQISVGALVNQQSSETSKNDTPSGFNLSGTAQRIAQSFSVPYTDATFQGVTMVLDKTGTPGTITWRIETDNGDKPSGALADANATGTIAAASVPTSKDYVTGMSANPFTLSANTKYWLVIKGAATLDGSNLYTWYCPSVADYTRGHVSRSTDSGSTWADPGNYDMTFKLLYGGLSGSSSVKHSVEYTKTYL